MRLLVWRGTSPSAASALTMHRIHSPQTRTVIAVILSYRVPTTIRGRVSTRCPNRDDISREIEPMPVTGCDIPLRRKPQRSAQNAESARGDDYLTAGHKPLRSADYGTCTGEIIRTAHDRHVIGP